MLRLWSPLVTVEDIVDEAILIVLVAVPGAGAYPLNPAYPLMLGSSFEGALARFGITLPLMV